MGTLPYDIWLRVAQHNTQLMATLSMVDRNLRMLLRPHLLAIRYVQMWRRRLGFRAFYERAGWVYRPCLSSSVIRELKGDDGEDLISKLMSLVLSCFVYLSLHPQPSRIQLFKAVLTIIANYIAPLLPLVRGPPVPLDIFHHVVRSSADDWFDVEGYFKGWVFVHVQLVPQPSYFDTRRYAPAHDWFIEEGSLNDIYESIDTSHMWADIARVISAQPPQFADLFTQMLDVPE